MEIFVKHRVVDRKCFDLTVVCHSLNDTFEILGVREIGLNQGERFQDLTSFEELNEPSQSAAHYSAVLDSQVDDTLVLSGGYSNDDVISHFVVEDIWYL